MAGCLHREHAQYSCSGGGSPDRIHVYALPEFLYCFEQCVLRELTHMLGGILSASLSCGFAQPCRIDLPDYPPVAFTHSNWLQIFHLPNHFAIMHHSQLCVGLSPNTQSCGPAAKSISPGTSITPLLLKNLKIVLCSWGILMKRLENYSLSKQTWSRKRVASLV